MQTFVIFFLIPVVGILNVYFILYDKIQAYIANIDLSFAVTIIALLFQISDFICKLTIARSESDIDDYLKTRPVSTQTLCRFIVFDNVFNSGNWLFIPTIATCLFLLFDFPTALLSTVLFIAISLMNGLALRTLFYSHNYESKAIVCSGGFLFFPIITILLWKFFEINWWLHFTIYIALCIAMQYFLYRCLRILRNYPDYSRTTAKNFSFYVRESTLPAYGTLRSYWMRFMLCIIQIIPLMTFFTSFINAMHPLYATSIITPFMMISMFEINIFGLEANYMDGLWSRPVSIKKLLHYNYIFYSSICMIDAILISIAVFQHGISQIILVMSVALFNIGFINNILLAGIFGSVCIDLFQSSLMKANKRPNNNILVIMTYFPVIIFEFLLATHASMEVFCSVTGGIGLTGIILHPYFTRWMARKYVANRYKHFERYRN